MSAPPRNVHMLPPRVVDPSRIDAVVRHDVDLARLMGSVALLSARAKTSAVCPIGMPGGDRRVVIGRPASPIDRLRFPHGVPNLAFCAFFQERATFAWTHDGRSWVMSVAVSSTVGMPSRLRAPAATRNILDTLTCVLDVASGRLRGARMGGEAVDRIRTTARLATIGCCQSGDDAASMNFADERVVGAGKPSHLARSTLTLSAQGAALLPMLPSTVVVSTSDVEDGVTFVDVHSPMIQARMPDDAMDRLRVMAEAEGLPILYRWLRP